MLAKVNEMNKNTVILLSVGIIAITSLVIALLVSGGGTGGKTSAELLTDFQEAFTAEHGVESEVRVTVYEGTEDQAENITNSMSEELKLNAANPEEYEGHKWYSTKSDSGDIEIIVQYE